MKVLHVIDALGVGGGAEHSLAEMLPLLREAGVDSEVVTLFPREGGLQQRLIDLGFGIRCIGDRSWAGRVRALRREIRTQQPDIVHATLYNACLVTRLACVGSDVVQLNSLVNVSYDPIRIEQLGVPRWKLRIARTIDAWSARILGQHFHAITDAVRREATEVLRIPDERIVVIPRGRTAPERDSTGTVRRAMRAELGIDDGAPVLLTVGRQDRQKGHEILVRAFAQVLDARPDAVLLVAGRAGDATPDIESTVASLRLGDQVRLLGHRTDVACLHEAADVFVFPSLYEGLGGSLLEAMSMGSPIIASDAPAIAEVLGDGQYGWLVPRGEIGPLAAAVESLLSDGDRRHSLAQRATTSFHERYETNKVVAATLAHYQSLALSHPTGRP